MLRLHITPPDEPASVHELAGGSLVLGRSSQADLTLPDRFLSRRHLRVTVEDEGVFAEDLGSRNGSFVNGQRIEGLVPVGPGDEIKIGSSVIRLLGEEKESPRVGPEPSRTATAAPEGHLDPTVESLDLVGSHTVFHSAADLLSRYEKPETGAPAGMDPARYAERLAIINEVHKAAAGSITRQDLLELVLERIFEHLRPEEAVVFLAEDDGGYRRAARKGAPDLEAALLSSRTLLHEVSDKGQAALALDARTDERFAEAVSMMDSGVRSLVAAPLLTPEGSLGMIAASSRLSRRQFDEEDMDLLASLASVAALRIWSLSLAEEAAERRRFERELELARRIQTALLPEEIPPFPGFDIRATGVPSRGVSGDLYKVVPLAGGAGYSFLVADVSGKGLSASLLTATLEALSAGPIADGRPPGEVLARVNRLLEERTPDERFATAFLGTLDPVAEGTGASRMAYASAGHNPALLLRVSGEVEELSRTGLPLGLVSPSSYGTAEAVLEPGDTLVVYTDGITEATDPDDEEYGLERLIRLCREHRGDDPGGLLAAIDRELEAFAAGVPFADDRTLVVVRRLAV